LKGTAVTVTITSVFYILLDGASTTQLVQYTTDYIIQGSNPRKGKRFFSSSEHPEKI
jgi:hypothetical protein